MRELEVFRAVMEAGGVTGAAERLSMSQPAASKMLQGAEARLGFALFRRDRQRLVPTAEAYALMPELLGTFAAIDGLERLAAALRAGQGGQISVAAVPVLATALLPPAVTVFRAARPEVLVRLRALSAIESVNQVANHQADLGVILGSTADPRIEVRQLHRSEIGCALPAKHPFASRPFLALQDLEAETVISLSPAQPVGQLVQVAWSEAGIARRLAIEVSQSSIACALVRAGAGIAVLDGFGLAEARAQGLVTRPLRPWIPLDVTLILDRGRECSRLTTAFVRALEETLSSTLGKVEDQTGEPDIRTG
ncbi:LysR substrate-binding domain-containing protein [Muricoccus pecuniae]|uniref:DNA-binding transcriptional LysR family regulator n=1 Tax=Muricoccus pecuniae TaxID=693023 RepID=A0A840Y613_9PROT|nr:LysR substrate-binding domain-containing protein [Roseomonas pecuniae]MBB5696598.1 DNA-binding transcriptional LysR family regulator [Roseomonas pecuniae]